jgi:hypothetical protein
MNLKVRQSDAARSANAVNSILSVIARLDRAIQYSVRSTIERGALGYWIARFRGQ